MPYEVGSQACCLLEVCCGGDHQIEAFAKWLEQHAGLNKHEAKKTAKEVLEAFDLAPHGTLKPFKRAIAELARKYPPDPGY